MTVKHNRPTIASYVPTRAQAAELVWNRATEGATP